MSQIIDLSKTVRYNPKDPFFMRVKVKHKLHNRSKWIIRLLGLPFKFFPKGWEGWADDHISMGVHATTHMDAPWHYSPECGGKPAKTVDQIPLEWCTGPGIVIDMAHKGNNDAITKKDIESFLNGHNLSIAPGMIVLIRTGRDRYMGTPEFFSKGTGMDATATEYLVDQGVKVMGIDQWGWDLPLKYMVKAAKESGSKDAFWQAHLVGKEKEYCHMEQLTNLDQLPISGFTVMAFPLKIEGASAAPARVVAILDPIRK